MDVRLYPSAPAVGARAGAEPAGLAHLDYYHCGKVGRGRVSRARVWGRSHLAVADAATLGLTRGTGTQQPRRRARAAHTATLAVTHTPELQITGRSQPDSHPHDDTVTHSPTLRIHSQANAQRLSVTQPGGTTHSLPRPT
ncbi:hypothetical protein NN561_009966 [Cricetulus griseus]